VPVIARRTEKHLAQAAEKRVERWRRIAREASQQSRRVIAPEIADPLKLSEALSFEAEQRIVLAENERGATLIEILRSVENLGSLALAVGPEGGWADDELQAFARADWTSASLGDTILRAETAAIAALAIARAECP
jgi:16S rRNA (uracil1498-N3)-methyltransferase